MKTRASLKNRQGGAVAIMVGFSIFLLIGMAALVVDLGHLYLARTGLQNAADAAALSGAKQLDGTADGICCGDGTSGAKLSAVHMAVTTGGSNSFFGNLGQEQVDLGAATASNPNIRFSRDPNGSEGTGGNWGLSITDAKSNPGGIYFVRVDTGSKSLSTWFAAIWNILNTNTKAVAVAGRHETPIAPIGICALDKNNESHYVSESGNWPKYLAEWGFRRGTSYEFGSINTAMGVPSGMTSGTELYLNPIATSSATCTGNPDMVIPICTGTSTINGNTGSTVYANTGGQVGKSIPAINTRFNVYDNSIYSSGGGGLSLAELQASCPPDSNLTEFKPSLAFGATGWMLPLAPTPIPNKYDDYQSVSTGSKLADQGKSLAAWLAGTNVIDFTNIAARNATDGGCQDSIANNCNNNYGVLWSYARPLTQSSNGAVPSDAGLSDSDWNALYPDGPTYSGTSWAPKYSGNKRRIINAVILNCSNTVGAGNCAEITVLGIGEFFLQTQADNTGSKIYGEFSRLLPQPLPPANIRLYR